MAKLARDLNTGKLLRGSGGKLCRGCCGGGGGLAPLLGCYIGDNLGFSTPRTVSVSVSFPDLSCCEYRAGYWDKVYEHIMDEIGPINLVLDRPYNLTGCSWQGIYTHPEPLLTVNTRNGYPDYIYDLDEGVLACDVWPIWATGNRNVIYVALTVQDYDTDAKTLTYHVNATLNYRLADGCLASPFGFTHTFTVSYADNLQLLIPCSTSIPMNVANSDDYYVLRGNSTYAEGDANFGIVGVDNSYVLPWTEGRTYYQSHLVMSQGYRFKCIVQHAACGAENYEPLVSPNWAYRWVQETF